MRRFLSAAIAVLCLFSCFGISVSAEEITYSDSVDWNKFRGQGIEINVYNWGEYISVDEGEEGDYDTNAAFEELTGIKVNYTTFASNEELYAKIKSGGFTYDIVIPSDYMAGRLRAEGMIQKLNFDNIPNVKWIDDKFSDPAYDPTNEYTVPYTWGYVGIIYNTTMVDEEDDVASWDILWNEKYAKNILMFNNSRDAFAIALFRDGYSVNTTDIEELHKAATALSEQKNLVQSYVMDEIFDKMGGGEAALAPYYAGDAVTMMEDNPDLAFAVPKEGTNMFVDVMCIPTAAANKEAAEMYINFMCETQVALKNIEYICYSSPHTGAYELLDEEVKNNPTYYPSDEALKNTEVYNSLPENVTKEIDSLWTDIMSNTGANPWLTPIFLVAAIGIAVYINARRAYKKKHKNDQ